MTAKSLTLFALLCIFGLGVTDAARASSSQELTLVMHGDGAQATGPAEYDPSYPVDVRVRVDRDQKLDGVTIVATGPNGESLSTPLVRAVDDTFRGSLALEQGGVWSLRISSRVGKIAAQTTPIAVNVAAAPTGAWVIGAGTGVAIFVIFGLSGFFILRRTLAVPPERERSQAA